MTDITRTNALTLTPIHETSAENTNESLIEMTVNDPAGEHAKDHIEMRSMKQLEMNYVEDGSGSFSEVDGRRKTRSSQTQSYDIHKGIAESAMDISLLTANANQLRLLLTYNEKSHTFIACIALVITSLVLQIFVASGVIIVKYRFTDFTTNTKPTVRYDVVDSFHIRNLVRKPRPAAMTSATIYRMKHGDNASSNQLEDGTPTGPGPSRTVSEESTYDSAAS
uniref:Ninjurin a n=1 Tax=Anopheles maculatus TaxID=74869 RepID=A0A182T908_9DIPT